MRASFRIAIIVIALGGQLVAHPRALAASSATRIPHAIGTTTSSLAARSVQVARVTAPRDNIAVHVPEQADSVGSDTIAAISGAPVAEPAAPPSPEAPAGSGAPPAGNALNPNLSVIAWLQATGGSPRVAAQAFEEREAEIGLQSVVDPYARADFFLSATESGLDLEEGYATFTQLPWGLGLRAGRFRSHFARFNQTHPGETPFADRPLMAERLFGEEGLSGTGLSASYLIPLSFYLNLDAELTTAPSAEAGGVFARTGNRKDLMMLGRLTAFFDVSEATNLNLSLSAANAPGNSDRIELLDAAHARATVLGAEMSWRWKNPRRAIYRAVTWQTEAFLARFHAWEYAVLRARGTTDLVAVAPARNRHGVMSYVDWQFARRYHAGLRLDAAQGLGAATGHETGQAAFLTYTPSEFMLLSTQLRHVRNLEGGDDWNEFVKLTFNIGPHGAHPF